MIPRVTRDPDGSVLLHMGKKPKRLTPVQARALAARLLCASNAEAQELVDLADDVRTSWGMWCEFVDRLPTP